MSKPQRRLWELNNRHREFWEEPPRPEPEGGFAAGSRPPGYEMVTQWFREATGGQPHRRRRPVIPADEYIDRIARLVTSWCDLLSRPTNPEAEIAVHRGHQLQKAAAELDAALRGWLDLALPGRALNDPAVDRMVDLSNALKLALPYIGRRRKQGEKNEPWGRIAEALREWVAEALKGAGHTKITISGKGPLVKVICLALAEIDGEEHDPEAVASWLRNHPRTGD